MGGLEQFHGGRGGDHRFVQHDELGDVGQRAAQEIHRAALSEVGGIGQAGLLRGEVELLRAGGQLLLRQPGQARIRQLLHLPLGPGAATTHRRQQQQAKQGEGLPRSPKGLVGGNELVALAMLLVRRRWGLPKWSGWG